MLHLISILIQFVVTATDPSWTCTATHRDPGVAGTYYLYCSQQTPAGIELIRVGRFVADAPKATP